MTLVRNELLNKASIQLSKSNHNSLWLFLQPHRHKHCFCPTTMSVCEYHYCFTWLSNTHIIIPNYIIMKYNSMLQSNPTCFESMQINENKKVFN